MAARFDIDALRTLVAGTDAGSFARAAVQLGRSQSAVSMQLKRLEEQAGLVLFERKGRGLVLTEAGDALLHYARRIVELHDDAARALGAATRAATIRVGLPQDFAEDVLPEAMTLFAHHNPDVHVEVRAGRNHALEEEVRAGRLDLAIAFARPGTAAAGDSLVAMPMYWFKGTEPVSRADPSAPIPLVLFNHPCLFRQAALQALDKKGVPWRLALTTPSLPGVWAALRFGRGITARTAHAIPEGIYRIDDGGTLSSLPPLPPLPPLELRMFVRSDLSRTAARFRDVLASVVQRLAGHA
ncbi:DNA-binding transcriptional LysR family regulator [Alloalcanivorax xenomutans]|uniref:LysR substrate-binding domain-containing protein n=1 Tax=Alloalcanivorax xenomutans TaxID=1094342 RepID=UPI000BD03403|nr:LysR substrate-binding domain-containing protein [Alloalcanivorax xenomutans]SOC00961.1 DNA-binding transcriptional LysR family regulator [Alloalcanivorax xenomutans]